jgi:thiol-disulfide isomerase/thioredoxin
MKNLLSVFTLLCSLCSYAQDTKALVRVSVSGYANEPVYIYKAYGDTLLLADSLRTDNQGRFSRMSDHSASVPDYKRTEKAGLLEKGLYRVSLKNNQWFYILYDGKTLELKTVYDRSARTNVAMDSLKVIQSVDNKLFYEFQKLQQQINVAEYFLKQMMRLYPMQDPFHIRLEDEYTKRYTGLDAFVKKQSSYKQSMAVKTAKAYYQPVVPDWKQPDYWRDSVLASHYFDFFNPADSFYMQSNILPEKMDSYISLRTHQVDAYGQAVKNEMQTAMAAQEFLAHVQANRISFDFCFNYLLKKLKKEHVDEAFLSVYDAFAKPNDGDCEQSKTTTADAWRDRVTILRKVQIGSTAPDFELEKGKLWLSNLENKYTLLVFWATWCPHCTEAMPALKDLVTAYKQQHAAEGANHFMTVAISLDTESEAWQKFVGEHNLYQFLNFSELKGWKSDVVKKYNVYATPTMILLDKNKKIVAKPETVNELKNILSTLN